MEGRWALVFLVVAAILYVTATNGAGFANFGAPLFCTVPLAIVGIGVATDRLAVAWFGLGAFSMASVMLVFSFGMLYLPVAAVLLLSLAWYHSRAMSRRA